MKINKLYLTDHACKRWAQRVCYDNSKYFTYQLREIVLKSEITDMVHIPRYPNCVYSKYEDIIFVFSVGQSMHEYTLVTIINDKQHHYINTTQVVAQRAKPKCRRTILKEQVKELNEKLLNFGKGKGEKYVSLLEKMYNAKNDREREDAETAIIGYGWTPLSKEKFKEKQNIKDELNKTYLELSKFKEDIAKKIEYQSFIKKEDNAKVKEFWQDYTDTKR